MDWFQELYDDFRQRTGFGSLPAERTRRDVDFIVEECRLEPGDRVLDLCAGTGRHSIELEVRGIRAVGIELNPDYVKLAEARAETAGVPSRVRAGDARSAEFGTDFDAAILMWNSFGYFSDPENFALLQKIRAALKPGGHFLLELLSRDFLLKNFEAREEREVDGIRVLEERQFDMLTSRMKSVITGYEGAHVERRQTNWRVYSLHELTSMGREVGLTLLTAYNDLGRNPVNLDTRLMRLLFARTEG